MASGLLIRIFAAMMMKFEPVIIILPINRWWLKKASELPKPCLFRLPNLSGKKWIKWKEKIGEGLVQQELNKLINHSIGQFYGIVLWKKWENKNIITCI